MQFFFHFVWKLVHFQKNIYQTFRERYQSKTLYKPFEVGTCNWLKCHHKLNPTAPWTDKFRAREWQINENQVYKFKSSKILINYVDNLKEEKKNNQKPNKVFSRGLNRRRKKIYTNKQIRDRTILQPIIPIKIAVVFSCGFQCALHNTSQFFLLLLLLFCRVFYTNSCGWRKTIRKEKMNKEIDVWWGLLHETKLVLNKSRRKAQKNANYLHNL